MGNQPGSAECEGGEFETKATTLNIEKTSFTWIVNNFGDVMDRKYEILSPIFTRNSSLGNFKWRIVLRPQDAYPGGCHVGLSLQKLSEDESIHSVMYTISIKDCYGNYHQVNTREKVFRHYLDSDDCLIGSNRQIIEENLLENGNLIIYCELDLLVSENLDNSVSKACEHSQDKFTKQTQSNKDDDIPANIKCFNDLSSSFRSKNTDNFCGKNMDFLIQNDNSLNEAKLNNSLNFEYDYKKDKEEKSLEILSDDLKDLYYNEKHEHDVTIYTKDGKLTAHRVILTCRSAYFKKMLKCNKNEVYIPAIDTNSLDFILYYLYTGKLLELEDQAAIDVLVACQMINLPHLSDMVQRSIRSPININNVIQVFKLAKDTKMENLKNNALKFLADNYDEIARTEEWNQMMKNDPRSAAEILLTIASFQNKLKNDS